MPSYTYFQKFAVHEVAACHCHVKEKGKLQLKCFIQCENLRCVTSVEPPPSKNKQKNQVVSCREAVGVA